MNCNDIKTTYSWTTSLYHNLEGASKLISPMDIIYLLSLIQLASRDETWTQIEKVLGKSLSLDSLKWINFSLIGSRCIKTNSIKENYKLMVRNIVDLDRGDGVQLLSYMSFSAKWNHGFNSKDTKLMIFHETTYVQMMHQVNFFMYYQTDKMQIVEMECKNDYVMGFILPKMNNSVDYTPNNIPQITPSELTEMINNLEYKCVDLYLPKFNHVRKNSLVPILDKMGIHKLFNESSQTELISDDYVTDVYQEISVTVDEYEKGFKFTQLKSDTLFLANRVFLYYVKHGPSGIIVSMGDYQA